MILTCPQCATRYQVDGAQFPAEGRKVRCARCGHVWQQERPRPEPEPVRDIEPVSVPQPVTAQPPPAVETHASVGPAEALGPERPSYTSPVATAAPVTAYEPEMPRARRSENAALVAGWIGLAIIVLAVVWCAVHFRQAIASAWPQSASFYAAVGMKVNSRGIDISDVVSHRSTQAGETVLSVSGDLTNITNHDVPVPTISIRLTDDDEHELDHWTFPATKAVLKPGQRIPFSTRRTNPPEDARHLEVTFAEAGG